MLVMFCVVTLSFYFQRSLLVDIVIPSEDGTIASKLVTNKTIFGYLTEVIAYLLLYFLNNINTAFLFNIGPTIKYNRVLTLSYGEVR